MNSKKKIQLISNVLYIYDDGIYLYCRNMFNGNLKGDSLGCGYPVDLCHDYNEFTYPNGNWEDISLITIDKIIQDKKLLI
ncbi:MAG: hypothetical protein ACFFCE_18910 [Promethearchaeota archaeon]